MSKLLAVLVALVCILVVTLEETSACCTCARTCCCIDCSGTNTNCVCTVNLGCQAYCAKTLTDVEENDDEPRPLAPMSECAITPNCAVQCQMGYVASCTQTLGCYCIKPKCSSRAEQLVWSINSTVPMPLSPSELAGEGIHRLCTQACPKNCPEDSCGLCGAKNQMVDSATCGCCE
jgi:hypothetical protein